MRALSVISSGMVTAVGLTAKATSAAVRAAINRTVDTRFKDRGGEWILGASVPLDAPWCGLKKLEVLATTAIRECLSNAQGGMPQRIPLLLCVAEADRAGRIDGIESLLDRVQGRLGFPLAPGSTILPQGRVGGVAALQLARTMIHEQGIGYCLVAGVDSYLVGRTLASYEARRRLLTSMNSNGFIPGEAAAAVLVGAPEVTASADVLCTGFGFGRERATVESEEPLRSDGLVVALRELERDGGVSLEDAEYRYTDCSGEQYWFKQDRLAVMRTRRQLRPRFDHLHPADCIGEVGAAVVPCVLGLALAAVQKRYASGHIALAHFSNDGEERAAMLLRLAREGIAR